MPSERNITSRNLEIERMQTVVSFWHDARDTQKLLKIISTKVLEEIHIP